MDLAIFSFLIQTVKLRRHFLLAKQLSCEFLVPWLWKFARAMMALMSLINL
jgi:hypothetical protein